jgi:hypothetical protein
MRLREVPLASNEACTNRQGVYDGWFFYTTVSGELHENNTYNVDLGYRIPDLRPPDLFKWMNDLADDWRFRHNQPVVKRHQVIAATITRLCFAAEHTGEPSGRIDASRRYELIKHLIVAREGAKGTSIERTRTNPVYPDFLGLLSSYQLGDPLPRNLLILPAYERAAEPLVTDVISLNTSAKTPARYKYASIRSGLPDEMQAIMYPSQLDFDQPDRRSRRPTIRWEPPGHPGRQQHEPMPMTSQPELPDAPPF